MTAPVTMVRRASSKHSHIVQTQRGIRSDLSAPFLSEYSDIGYVIINGRAAMQHLPGTKGLS
ncbi:hypothetical protein IMCC20628_01305 [Hoeflea sp. IMCC20628]|nr:hypothetical protein IMCC20628_01305 [Hoeflea sp. IMCC20628]